MAEDLNISLNSVLKAICRYKWIFLTAVLGVTILATAYAFVSTPLYTASVTVAPVAYEERGRGTGLGVVSQAIRLASIFYWTNPNRQKYLAILRSRELGVQFIEQQDLLPVLFSNQWNSDAKKWEPNTPGFLGRARRYLARTVAEVSGDKGWAEPPSVPTLADGYKKLNGMLAVTEDPETGLVEVSFTFENPELAARWANAYVDLANQRIREEQIREASRALSYLKKQAEKTEISALRETTYEIAETQLERRLISKGRREFAFDVIDKAASPETPSSPNRPLITICAVLSGTFLGTVLAIWRDSRAGNLLSESGSTTRPPTS